MNRHIAGTTIPKRMAAADMVNSLIWDARLSSTMAIGVSHRFDIGVIGYGAGEGSVQSAFEKAVVPVDEIAELARPPQGRFVHPSDWPGNARQQAADLPIWLEPTAQGQAVMRAAFERALAVAGTWTRQHPMSFPPIVINITGGTFTGKSPAPLVSEITGVATQEGNALVFNCHISEAENAVIAYPGPSSATSFSKRMRQLYQMSSVLPEPMRQEARHRGYELDPGARGYVLNAYINIIDFLPQGTRPMSL